MARYRIVQDGIEVAGASSDHDLQALNEALHYARQYNQDGPIRIERKRRGGWTLVAETHPNRS